MRAVWIGLLGVFSLGCSDDKSAAQGPSPGAAGADGGGGQGNGGGASDTAKLRWQVTELSSNPTPVGIEGVDICVHEHADIPCVKTDKDGFFDLPGLPRDTALNVTFEKTGYVPVLKSIETSNIDRDATGTPPISMPTVASPPTDFGFDVDTAKGVL